MPPKIWERKTHKKLHGPKIHKKRTGPKIQDENGNLSISGLARKLMWESGFSLNHTKNLVRKYLKQLSIDRVNPPPHIKGYVRMEYYPPDALVKIRACFPTKSIRNLFIDALVQKYGIVKLKIPKHPQTPRERREQEQMKQSEKIKQIEQRNKYRRAYNKMLVWFRDKYKFPLYKRPEKYKRTDKMLLDFWKYLKVDQETRENERISGKRGKNHVFNRSHLNVLLLVYDKYINKKRYKSK